MKKMLSFILVLSVLVMITAIAQADEDYMTESGEVEEVSDDDIMTDSGEVEEVEGDGDYMTDSGDVREVSED